MPTRKVEVRAKLTEYLSQLSNNSTKDRPKYGRFILTSQTRAAVVVFPTPGGPESRAALNPDPSSFPPNLPNLAAVKNRKTNSTRHRVSIHEQVHRKRITSRVKYLEAWMRLHCGFCASSSATAAACWHSCGLLAAQSQSLESVGGICPPTADCCHPRSLMGMTAPGQKMKRQRRKDSAPFGPVDLSLSQVECRHLCTCRRSLVPVRFLTGWECEAIWNSP